MVFIGGGAFSYEGDTPRSDRTQDTPRSGVTKEFPNPTSKEAEKAKAYAARNAWTLLGDPQESQGEIFEGEGDFSEGEV